MLALIMFPMLQVGTQNKILKIKIGSWWLRILRGEGNRQVVLSVQRFETRGGERKKAGSSAPGRCHPAFLSEYLF